MSWPLLLHSMATPELDAAGCLRTAAGLGLDGIELIVDADYPCALRPTAGAAEVRALASAAADHGVRVAALSPYPKEFNVTSLRARQAAADALGRVVDLAFEVGAGQVRVLAGVPVDDEPAALARAAETLRPVVERAATAEVSLNAENHMDTMATSAGRTVAFAQAAGLGIIYDPANLAILGADDRESAIEIQRELTRHVHVKNVASDRQPVRLAAGVVDWPRTLRALSLAGYSGALSFEYERRWYRDVLPPATIGLPPDIALVRRFAAEEESCVS